MALDFFYEMIMYNNYIDKMFVGEKLQQIKKRKEEVAAIDKTHVYIRGSGGDSPPPPPPEANGILQKCNLLPPIAKKNLTFEFVTPQSRGQNNILTPQ